MPTSPAAIKDFLLARPAPLPIGFRGADPDCLRQLIKGIGGHPLLTKTEPRRHQLEGLAFALWARRSLLFFEQRTGKTKIALDWLSYLIYSRLLSRTALIIAHAPIGVDVWEYEIAKHSELNVRAVRTGRDDRARFVDALEEGCDAVLVAWSTLQKLFSVKRKAARGARAGRDKLYADLHLARLASGFIGACVIDEIHMAGHAQTLRFQIAAALTGGCRWRLGITGTPFGRDPLLLWAQSFLMDSGAALGRSFWFFREAFCETKPSRFRGTGVDYVFDARKAPLLRDKLAATSLQCRLDEVQDVNVLKGVVHLSMSDEQRRAYNEAVERLVELRKGETVEIESTFVRLRQIASGYLPFVDGAGQARIVDFPDAAKFVWLEDWLEQLPDWQIVIFHEFIHTGARITKLLEKQKIKYEWLRGGTKNRPELLHRFQTKQTRILVANTATGGMAIDLSAADYMVFFESPPSVIVRRQAEARPLARGSRPVVVDDVVCASIERKLLDFLEEGENLRERLLDNPRQLAMQLRE